jgi:hypothetical protein
MADIVLSQRGSFHLLSQKVTYLNTLKVRLFKNNYTPTQASLLADFTASDVVGYAEQPLVIDTVTDNLDGTSTASGPLIIWTPTATTTTNSIYGVYVVDPGDGNKVIFSQRFTGGPFTWGDTLLQFAVPPIFGEWTH